MGWAEAQKPEEINGIVKSSYIRHYKEIKHTVPKEQLLKFKIADGWEPLCKFLGKDGPIVRFPRLNDGAAYKKHWRMAQNSELKKFAKGASSVVGGGRLPRIRYVLGI